MNATETKTTGKGKSRKAAAPATPAVVIPVSIKPPTTHGAQLLKLADIVIEKKTDRIHDAAFEEGIKELAANIATHGLLNPITVVPLKGGLTKDGDVVGDRMYLVAGERRCRACKLLGWTDIQAVIMDKSVDVLDARAAENLQREDIDEDVKALTIGGMVDRAIDQLCEAQGVRFDSLDAPAQDALRVAAIKAVAERMGWPVPRVRDYAFTAQLPEEVASLLRQGRLTLSHCRVLAQLPDSEQMVRFARVNAAGEDPVLEPAKPLADLKRDVAGEIARLNKAPWDLKVAFGPKHADGKPHACATCPHNSLNRTGLFDGEHLRPERTNRFDANSNWGVSDLDLAGGICGKLSCYRGKAQASKAAWRGAADRIAKKVAEAKPAERGKLKSQLLKEASQRCEFVPISTFGRLATARIKQRLEAGTPAKKAAAALDHKKNAEQQEQRRKAEHRLREVERDICEKIEHAVIAAFDTMEPWRRVLFQSLCYTEVGRQCFDYGRAKPDTTRRFRSAATVVLTGTETAAFDAVIAAQGKKDQGLDIDGNLKDLQVLVEIFSLQDIPPAPKLEDFLPKKEPAAKKGRVVMSLPAAKKKSKATRPAAEVDSESEED